MTSRTRRARVRLEQIQTACLGKKLFKPKDIRSTMITRNVRLYPEDIIHLAQQVGNSVAVIQQNYLNNSRVRKFVMD